MSTIASAGCSAIVTPDVSRLTPDGGVVTLDAASVDGGPPDSGPPMPCDTPGATEDVACGNCGIATRFCSGTGVWEYGPCEGQGECAAGTDDAIACGNCGEQTARCSASCAWEITGECSGEGVCAPGTASRNGVGCPAGQTRDVTCSDACVFEPASECMADGCPMPGATESVACGMCGTQRRFCSAAGVWEYGACEAEGECAPGTTQGVACGMCGMQASRCTDACRWMASGACTGEGTCAPGTTQRTSAGCPAGHTRVLQCDATCGFSIEVEPCTSSRPVDVMLLLDSTGSNEGALGDDLPTISSRCIAPLLAMRDVFVGVSYAGEFPVSTYGSSGDRPFEGGIEPTSSMTAIGAELSGRPRFSGADAEDSAVEALSMLSGGTVAMSSLPLTCSAGRTAGGCWRSGAQRVIVVHTDSPIHNGPDPSSSGLLAPYAGISPTPAAWPGVRTRMMSGGTLLIWLDSQSTSPAPAQFDEMLTDLGQPPTDHHLVSSSATTGVACDAIVARVRVLAGI
ncbi:MAG: hypothetical protein M3Y87_21470 [Myxococcota bacterium]|nr:hypothetical protein [Myxococcota bacterium]